MKLSTRERYATKALLELALHQGERPAPLDDIAQIGKKCHTKCVGYHQAAKSSMLKDRIITR